VKIETVTTHESSCACKDCASGKRNRFFRGKRMKAGEFLLEQNYGIDRRRLLTRTIAGWGVVFGVALDGPSRATSTGNTSPPEPGQLSVLRGLAMDRHGREAFVTAPATLGRDNTFLRQVDKGGYRVKSIETIEEGNYVLAIHYAECHIGEAALLDDCRCEKPEKNFVCETSVFSLTRLTDNKCPCGEPDCPQECKCCDGSPCAESGRGPHSCLCEWSAEATVPEGPAKTCLWQGYWMDPEDPVDLACVHISKVGEGDCDFAVSGWIIDDCTPRRIVKTNDLLYNLIRGCDLTRIESLSWGKWHRQVDPVPFDKFAEILAYTPPGENDDEVVTNLRVTFTGPVKTDTLTADCFALTVLVDAEDTGWSDTKSVFITGVKTSPPEAGDPSDTTRSAALCVTSGWYGEAVSRASVFAKEATTVRIEVYGDFILDCHGQAVDANARGFALQEDDYGNTTPSGNGTPGGTLESVFRVALEEE
jgi:hypothetical protein